MSGLFAQVTAALGFPLTLPIPGTPFTRGVAARREIIARLQPQIDKYRAALAQGGTGEAETGGYILLVRAMAGMHCMVCGLQRSGQCHASPGPRVGPSHASDPYKALCSPGGGLHCCVLVCLAAGDSPRPALLERWVAARDEAGRGLSDEQLHDNLVRLGACQRRGHNVTV
jgi:hypothetical protein